MTETTVAIALVALLALITIAIVRVRNLFAVAVLAGAYSFLLANILIVLDAVDVAMTEASVGAGISTVLVLSALHLTRTIEAAPMHTRLLPLAVAATVGAALIWAGNDLPAFGDPSGAMHAAGPDYMTRSVPETGIANVVSSVLASYRGYDTLGETTVIFTAGIGVLLLLKGRRREGRGGG